MLKMISFYCLTLDKWRLFWILPTMQCPKLFLTTPLDRAYMKTLNWTPKSRSSSYSVENGVNSKFDLPQMAAILNLFNFLRSLKDILLISGKYAI